MNEIMFESLGKSEIRNMSNECDKVGGINLSQGICDFPLNSILKKSVNEAMEKGFNHYTRHDGEQILREAIARKAKEYNYIEADPEKNIIVTCGATGALYCACAATLSPGDEVILFEPYYGYHEYTLLAMGIKPIYVKLNPPEWTIEMNSLEKVITKNTKAIIINTPLNPSGKVFNRSELKELGEFSIKHDLLVFTDEIYEYILYDGMEHISPASMKEFADRTITISGYSKTYSITGWRIGYCIAPEKYASAIGLISDLVYVCAPAPLQIAVANAINELPSQFYAELSSEFIDKRKLICDTLDELNMKPYVPQGAYYVLANIEILPGSTSKEKVMWLLKQTGVAAVPGSSFFHKEDDGNQLARFCFAKDNQVLEEACQRLKRIKEK